MATVGAPRVMNAYVCANDLCKKAFRSWRKGRRYCSDRCRDRRVTHPAAPSRWEVFLQVLCPCPVLRECGEGPRARLAEHVLYEHAIDPDWLFPNIGETAPLLPSFRTLRHGAMA